MAHELEITADGRASFVYVGATAWHRLGTQIPEDTSIRDAAQLARADYPVAVEPVFRRIVVGDTDDYVESAVARVTVRTDTGKELGRVSPDYTAVQNVDAFSVLQPLLDADVARVEAGGVLRDGQDAWMLVQVRPEATSAEACEQLGIAPYVLVRTNHSGRTGVLFQSTMVRVVCANTLRMAEESQIAGFGATVRHTGAAEARLVTRAQAILARVLKDATVAANQFTLLRRTFLDTQLFRELVLNVAAPLPLPREDKPVPTFVRERADMKRNRITALWTAGKGHVGDHSAWEALNAVVEWTDHDDAAYGGVPANRLASLTDGSLAQTRQRVTAGLLAHARRTSALAAF